MKRFFLILTLLFAAAVARGAGVQVSTAGNVTSNGVSQPPVWNFPGPITVNGTSLAQLYGYQLAPASVTTNTTFAASMNSTWTIASTQTLQGPIDFNEILDNWNFNVWPFAPNGNIVLANGTWNAPVGAGATYVFGNARFKIPFFAVSVNVAQMAGNPNGDAVFCGVWVPSISANIGFIYDNITKTITGYIQKSGNFYYAANGTLISGLGAAGAYSCNLSTTPFQLVSMFTGPCCSCWIKTSGNSFVPVAVMQLGAGVNLQTQANLSTVEPMWWPFNPAGSGGNIIITNVQDGYCGQLNFCTPTRINYEDGTPLIKGNKQFFAESTTNVACNATTGVTADETKICSIDQTTFQIQAVGDLSFLRNGQIYGDGGASIIYDRQSGLFRLTAPTWGTYNSGNLASIYINYYTTDANLLSGVHLLTNPTRLNLPMVNNATNVCEDGIMQMVAYGGNTTPRPVIGYVENPGGSTFYPTLAVGTDLTFSNVTLIARNTSLTNDYTEGSRFASLGNITYLLEGSLFGNFVVLNVSNATLNCFVDAYDNANSTPPHPDMYSVENGNTTTFFLLSFDLTYFNSLYSPGTAQPYSVGNARVWTSNITEAGYEKPVWQALTP